MEKVLQQENNSYQNPSNEQVETFVSQKDRKKSLKRLKREKDKE